VASNYGDVLAVPQCPSILDGVAAAAVTAAGRGGGRGGGGSNTSGGERTMSWPAFTFLVVPMVFGLLI
jgi:hypothetical protein